jgi:hypothetical protein
MQFSQINRLHSFPEDHLTALEAEKKGDVEYF